MSNRYEVVASRAILNPSSQQGSSTENVIASLKQWLTFCMYVHDLVTMPTQIVSRAAERNRRQAFRGEVHGRLPFDLIGMHDTVPSLNLSLSGGRDTDSPYSLERSDIKSAYSSPRRQGLGSTT